MSTPKISLWDLSWFIMGQTGKSNVEVTKALPNDIVGKTLNVTGDNTSASIFECVRANMTKNNVELLEVY